MRDHTPTLSELTTAFHKAWNAETGFAGGDWSSDNPARAQCLTSSLVVQDYYGGDLIRFAVRGEGISENHYCNLLEDGTLLDTTRSQYTTPVTMQVHPVNLGGYSSLREKRLDDEETRMRYELLKRRLAEILNA